MEVTLKVLTGIAVLVAILFAGLVFITGKGDAMSGGTSVRTTFKGKQSFDDIMSKWTLGFGVSFMALMLLINVLADRVGK